MATNIQLACTGMEHGLYNAVGGGLFSLAPSGGSVIAGAARTGSYGLRVNATGGVNVQVAWDHSATSEAHARLYVKFITLPTADSWLIAFGPNVGSPSVFAGVSFIVASGALRGFCSDSLQAPPYVDSGTDDFVPSTGVWYRIDLRGRSSDPAKIEWQVDGAAMPTFTAPAGYGGNTFRRFNVGMISGGGNNEMYFDDVVVLSQVVNGTPAYPVGPGGVWLMTPGSEGTHANATSFADDTGTSPPGTPHLRVDEVPNDTTDTDWFEQTVAAAGDYIELKDYTDLPAEATTVFHAAAVVQGGNIEVGAAASGGTQLLKDDGTAMGSVSWPTLSTTTKRWYRGHVTAGLALPTRDEVNGFKTRYGFWTSVQHIHLRNLFLEVAMSKAEAVAGPYWGIALG